MQRVKILFLDVETVTVEEDEKRKYQGFRLMCSNLLEYRTDSGWKTVDRCDFVDMPSFFDYFESLVRKKSLLYVISANIWFDIRNCGLFHYLTGGGWAVKVFYNNGWTAIYKFHKDKTSVVCLNMQQFIPASVKRMGDIIDLPKLDTSVTDPDDDKVMIYCRRDVDIISETFKHWISFLVSHDLGSFRYTLAAQSFCAYRHRFMHREIFIHGNDYLTKFEHECYYGGRVELFRHGTISGQRLYKLDVNSMYPSIMADTPMPIKWAGTDIAPGIFKLPYLLLRYLCFARVAISTDEPAYPVLRSGKLMFPIGRFTTYLSHPELVYAMEHRHIEAIDYLIYYKKAIIFKEYVTYFYKLRQQYKAAGNEVFDYLTKVMINSLYGKFAQRVDQMIFETEEEECRYEVNTIIDPDSHKRLKELWIGTSRKVFEEGALESIHSLVAIPAMITSMARLKLWRYIIKAGRDNVFYCDTDSLFTNQDGYQNLIEDIHPTQLGALSMEKETDRIILYGLKDYIFGGKVTLKGIRPNAVQNSDGGYEQLQFPGFKGDMKHGLDKPYGIIKMTKHLSRKYHKGVISDDGRVLPFEWAEF